MSTTSDVKDNACEHENTVFCNGEQPLYTENSRNTKYITSVSSHHPGIYLTFGNESTVVCPYCSRVFHKEKSVINDHK